jgi:hypothetical protein
LLVHPGVEELDGRLVQRRVPALAALSQALEVSPCPEVDVLAAQAGQFGQAKAGPQGDGEQDVVASADPGAAIRRGEQDVHLGLGEEGPGALLGALLRDGEDLLDARCVLGVTVGGEPEERVDGSQAGVTAAGAVAAFALEVIEKSADQVGIEIGQVEVRRIFAGPGLGVGEQQAEGVPVGVDRVRAGVALPAEPGGEECLKGGGERSHDRALLGRRARSLAKARSSGTADIYQLFRYRNNWYYSDSRVIPIAASLAA